MPKHPRSKKARKDRYAAAMRLVESQGDLFWQSFAALLLPHTILLAFLLTFAFDTQQTVDYRPGPFFGGLAGIAFCLLWYAVHARSWTYYDFRIAQARHLEPPGWNLLKGNGMILSQGGQVIEGERTYQIPWPGRLPTRFVPLLVITIFLLLYSAIVLVNGPWAPLMKG